MNKHYEATHRYDFLTKELLEEEYLKNGLSDSQIAKKYEMPSKVVVWNKRKKFDIHNKYAAKSNRHATANRQFNITKEKALKMLQDGETFEDIAKYMGCSLMVAKRRFKELGLTNCQQHTEKYKFLDTELTNSQKQLLIGSMLGDGTITQSGAYAGTHCMEQLSYFTHKMNTLSSICSGKFQSYIRNSPSGSGKRLESLHFTTGTNRYCDRLRGIFYHHKSKIVPYDFLLENLSNEGLSYWFMDDGNYHNKNARLYTNGFSCLDNLLLKQLFKVKWNIDAKIRIKPQNNKYYYYLGFGRSETKLLITLIRPYIIPSMLYKIDGKV